MKLRIQKNTIRVRLNDREVEDLQAGSHLVNETWFPDAKLEVSLVAGTNNDTSFVENKIRIIVDKKNVDAWASSDDVTIALEFDVSNDKKLSILVEKDMKV